MPRSAPSRSGRGPSVEALPQRSAAPSCSARVVAKGMREPLATVGYRLAGGSCLLERAGRTMLRGGEQIGAHVCREADVPSLRIGVEQAARSPHLILRVGMDDLGTIAFGLAAREPAIGPATDRVEQRRVGKRERVVAPFPPACRTSGSASSGLRPKCGCAPHRTPGTPASRSAAGADPPRIARWPARPHRPPPCRIRAHRTRRSCLRCRSRRCGPTPVLPRVHHAKRPRWR